jgi:cold shock CspA family protein
MVRPGKAANDRRPTPGRVPEQQGLRTTGRISRLLVGQSQGFIREKNDRQVFFHRGDVAEGTSFNELVVGDAVTFELVEDAVSGARASGVSRKPPG